MLFPPYYFCHMNCRGLAVPRWEAGREGGRGSSRLYAGVSWLTTDLTDRPLMMGAGLAERKGAIISGTDRLQLNWL